MSRALYTVFIALVALQRLAELRISRRHAERLLARGGVEHGRGHYGAMVALHAAFLPSCVAETWLARRPFLPELAAFSIAAFVTAQALRLWTQWTLGERWCTRVIVLPNTPPIDRGPFRYLRHPNYVAVAIEFATIPMIHAAWITAIVFSALNAAMLAVRIRVEDRALRG